MIGLDGYSRPDDFDMPDAGIRQRRRLAIREGNAFLEAMESSHQGANPGEISLENLTVLKASASVKNTILEAL